MIMLGSMKGVSPTEFLLALHHRSASHIYSREFASYRVPHATCKESFVLAFVSFVVIFEVCFSQMLCGDLRTLALSDASPGVLSRRSRHKSVIPIRDINLSPDSRHKSVIPIRDMNLSSRPERSGVEGPCVFKQPVLFTQDFPNAIYFWDTTFGCRTSINWRCRGCIS
jgi:hypothetical protein